MTDVDVLRQVAWQAMVDKGLEPDFSKEVEEELEVIREPSMLSNASIKDLRKWLWFSIDNDDSRDLDQLTFVERVSDGGSKVYVAIADVDGLVEETGAINQHAALNTTSVYTPGKVFSMLPEKLSTDLSSLNPEEDRRAMVIEVSLSKEGKIQSYDVYPAFVHSHAKLAYNSVAAWLDGKASPPDIVAKNPELQQQILLNDAIAKTIRHHRQTQGTLSLETTELQVVFEGDRVQGIKEVKKNSARSLIESLMIAANTAATQFLKKKGYPLIKRVVRAPKRWDRIVKLAEEYGEKLPEEPNSKALEQFLLRRKAADPFGFAELSLTVIKSLGRGEFVLSWPDNPLDEHFALALQDYLHVTAPNRLYLDLVLQRMLKAAIKGDACPYSLEVLDELARHCTLKAADAEKVERRVKKSAVAMLLQNSIGKVFEGIITGTSESGTWVKISDPAVEGKVVKGFNGLDVGDHLQVKLVHVDPRQGYIDFARL